MDPFLKSVGGKRWLAADLTREIMRLEPKFYVEAFAGGGAVALTLHPGLDRLVSDANPDFMATWQAIKACEPEEVMAALTAVEKKYPNTGLGYAQAVNALREHEAEPNGRPLLERAALTLYINYRCYNGLWRVNQSGQFNVPWAQYKPEKLRRFTLEEFKLYHTLLQTIEVCHADFRVIFDRLCGAKYRGYRNKIVVYADPPYDSVPNDKGQRGFSGYTAEGFNETDQRDLARWLQYLTGLGMHVFSTNADTPLIRELYAWAQIQTIVEYHSVGSRANRRGEKPCLLIRGKAAAAPSAGST